MLVGFNICHLSAQMSIRVPEVGELRAQLTEEEAQQVTHLTLTGKLNAIDFKVLRDEFNKLEYLDLTRPSQDPLHLQTGLRQSVLREWYYHCHKNHRSYR